MSLGRRGARSTADYGEPLIADQVRDYETAMQALAIFARGVPNAALSRPIASGLWFYAELDTFHPALTQRAFNRTTGPPEAPGSSMM